MFLMYSLDKERNSWRHRYFKVYLTGNEIIYFYFKLHFKIYAEMESSVPPHNFDLPH